MILLKYLKIVTLYDSSVALNFSRFIPMSVFNFGIAYHIVKSA